MTKRRLSNPPLRFIGTKRRVANPFYEYLKRRVANPFYEHLKRRVANPPYRAAASHSGSVASKRAMIVSVRATNTSGRP